MLLGYGQRGGLRRSLSKVHRVYHKTPQAQLSLYSHSAKGWTEVEKGSIPDGDIDFSSSTQRSYRFRGPPASNSVDTVGYYAGNKGAGARS